MKTKAIREVLEMAKGHSPHSADVRRAEEALRDLELICNAAEIICRCAVIGPSTGVHAAKVAAARGVMHSIRSGTL